ncbi:MAG: PHA/PHB synthase family protein [Gaiellaceae bacterium]
MATDERDAARNGTPDPDWGLGATADPVAFGAALAGLGKRLAREPALVAGAALRFASGLAEIGGVVAARALGASTAGPASTDEPDARFADPAWETNPGFYGLRQCYLLWARTMKELAAAANDEELGGKAEFAVGQMVDALAPTNFLVGNPAALKRAFETGGASVTRGVARFVDDVVSNGGWPRQVDTSKLVLGEDLAATTGKVVFRNRLMELIQFAPRTETVFETPLLLSPPWINKYYVMDLAPGKSFAEWAIDQGHTVFCISYRNPDESFREIGFEDYLREGPLQALDVIGEITGEKQANIVALCLGGTLTAVLLGHLASTKAGRARIRSATLLNALVDFSEPGPLGHFVDAATVERLERRMAKRGYLGADEIAGTFNLLRANDLVWRYVSAGWLMGEDPPAFDILQWNADSTRMPARMHSEYLRWMYVENRLAEGTLKIGGRTVSLANATSDLYVLSAREDHITPWRGCYRTTQLAGGPVRFVLTSSGHIAGIVNPPGPKRKHWRGDELPADPDDWFERATQVEGSWWEDWARWANERAGEQREPPALGTETHPPLEDAPGSYVRES